MVWWMWLLACGGEPSEPAVVPEPTAAPAAEEAVADVPPVSPVTHSKTRTVPSLDPIPLPWLGFSEVPEGMKGCQLEQKFGNPLFEDSVAMRCAEGGRMLAAAVSTERWDASASALMAQTEAALGAPRVQEQRLGWTVKQWTEGRSAVTALLQADGQTVYVGCVDGPSERTCLVRVEQLITGLGREPAPE